jgi:hypothetical protein
MNLIRLSKQGHVIYWCFGCRQYHGCDTLQENKNGGKWEWNGSFENPSLKPSIRFYNPDCHHHVTDGKIVYHSDCSHDFQNQEVSMRNFSENFDQNIMDWVI